MSVHKDSQSVGTSRLVNRLFIALRDKIQPEESTREDKKYYDKIEKFEYQKIQDDLVCDAVTGIPVEKFGKYLEELQERHQLPDKAKKAFEDALISSGKNEGLNEFKSENGEIRMFSLEFVVFKQNQTINLASAMYYISLKNDEEEQTDGKMKPFTMSLKKKNAFIKLYKKRLYKSVDQKCKQR